MATYLELRGLFNDADLRNRVTTAVLIAADGLLKGATPTTNDRAWALNVITNPDSEGRKAYMLVLAANNTAAVAAIKGASDSVIQSQVDSVVPQLVSAFAGV